MEEKKMFGAIAVVAVILVAAFCGVTLMKDDKDTYEAKVTGNVPVFGNCSIMLEASIAEIFPLYG